MRPKLLEEFAAFKNFRRPRFIWGSLVIATAAAIILFLATTGCSTGPTETRENSFSVAGSSRVLVNSVNGIIEVNAGLGNEVLVQATLRDAPRVKYELSQVGNTVTVMFKPLNDGGSSAALELMLSLRCRPKPTWSLTQATVS